MRIIETQEAEPAQRPGANVQNATWARFEAWCSYRWGKREVVWLVHGGGTFRPPLLPAQLTRAERWENDAWEELAPTTGPFGLSFPDGAWRLTYQVGADHVREDVLEAAQRYESYVAELAGMAGASSMRDGDYAVTRAATAMARALELSGAADLLRDYR